MKIPNAMLRRAVVTLQVIIGSLLALILLTGEATSADIRVFSGGGPQDALRHLAPEFERATGHHVEFTFQLVTEIQRKLAAGEKADVIVLPVPLIAATAKTVPLRTEGRIVLARVGIAVIVRQGTTPPDISTGRSRAQDAAQCPSNRVVRSEYPGRRLPQPRDCATRYCR
jgi:ABC-type molybdate transport system substrate-binding protein